MCKFALPFGMYVVDQTFEVGHRLSDVTLLGDGINLLDNAINGISGVGIKALDLGPNGSRDNADDSTDVVGGVNLPLDSKGDGVGVGLGDGDVVSVLDVLDGWDGDVVVGGGGDVVVGGGGDGDGGSGGVVGDGGREGGDLDLLNLGGLNLDLLDGSHGQGVGVGQGGGHVVDSGSGDVVDGRSGSVGDDGGSGGGDDGGDVADGVDETVLVDVLGEAFQGKGPEAVLGGDEVTAEDGVDWAGHLGGGGSGGGGSQSNNSEGLHVESRKRSVKCVLLE